MNPNYRRRPFQISVPAILIVIVAVGSAALAVIDPAYRPSFAEFCKDVIIGYWAWTQAAREKTDE